MRTVFAMVDGTCVGAQDMTWSDAVRWAMRWCALNDRALDVCVRDREVRIYAPHKNVIQMPEVRYHHTSERSAWDVFTRPRPTAQVIPFAVAVALRVKRLRRR